MFGIEKASHMVGYNAITFGPVAAVGRCGTQRPSRTASQAKACGGGITASLVGRHTPIMKIGRSYALPGIGGGSVSLTLGRAFIRSYQAATFGDAFSKSPLSGIFSM